MWAMRSINMSVHIDYPGNHFCNSSLDEKEDDNALQGRSVQFHRFRDLECLKGVLMINLLIFDSIRNGL